MATRIRILISDLRTAAASSSLSNRKLAHLAGLHLNTLRGLRTPGWCPTVRTLERLETILIPATRPAAAPSFPDGITLQCARDR